MKIHSHRGGRFYPEKIILIFFKYLKKMLVKNFAKIRILSEGLLTPKKFENAK